MPTPEGVPRDAWAQEGRRQPRPWGRSPEFQRGVAPALGPGKKFPPHFQPPFPNKGRGSRNDARQHVGERVGNRSHERGLLVSSRPGFFQRFPSCRPCRGRGRRPAAPATPCRAAFPCGTAPAEDGPCAGPAARHPAFAVSGAFHPAGFSARLPRRNAVPVRRRGSAVLSGIVLPPSRTRRVRWTNKQREGRKAVPLRTWRNGGAGGVPAPTRRQETDFWRKNARAATAFPAPGNNHPGGCGKSGCLFGGLRVLHPASALFHCIFFTVCLDPQASPRYRIKENSSLNSAERS